MVTLIETLPPGVNHHFRPGNPFAVPFTWPTGSLAGRTFTATLGTTALTVGIAGDIMTISASAAQTAAITAPADWVLTETTGGASTKLAIGIWKPSNNPAAMVSQPYTVVLGGASVTVDVSGSAGLAAHESRRTLDGLAAPVHGVIDHDWDLNGWAPFTPVTITEDAATSVTQSVVGGKGVLTGVGVGGGDRIAYLRQGTEWLDSEITSLIIGPTGWVGNNAQQGHLHRIRPISPGSTTYEAIAVWTAVFGGGYNLLNTQNVRFDGTSLLQGGGPGASSADAGYIDRTARTLAFLRFQFINWINEYTLQNSALLSHLIAGDTVTVTGQSNSTFNETNVAVLGPANTATGNLQVQDPVDTGAVGLTFSGGSIVPTSNEKKYCPYWLSTRVRGGSAASVTGQWKRWRLGEAEPPWSDPRVQSFTCVPDVDIPAGPPAKAGFCGLWNAHVSNGSTTQWGPCRFTKL
jgi:hypothetical protein